MLHSIVVLFVVLIVIIHFVFVLGIDRVEMTLFGGYGYIIKHSIRSSWSFGKIVKLIMRYIVFRSRLLLKSFMKAEQPIR